MSPRLLRFAALALALHAPGLCWAQTSAASEAPAPKPAAPAADVALLLPLDSPDFRGPADAFRQGFVAAASRAAKVPTVAVASTDASAESVLAGYQSAVAGGARVVVGPMTRSGVSAVAAGDRVKVPTLALNQPESAGALPRNLYVFGLAIEAETRYVARLAGSRGPRAAAVVTSTSVLAKRSRDAFVDEWLLLGGRITDVFEMQPSSDPALLRRALAKNPAELVFLAAEGDTARQLRLYLGAQLPVYATSQINTAPGDRLRSLDLAGVRFVDMPYILQADAFPTARPNLEGDGLRFYALGLDAFQIAAALLAGERTAEFDGATGRISVTPSGAIDRRPVGAIFRDGRSVAE
jgi:outer membrane PBP1 activator LpoA protein